MNWKYKKQQFNKQKTTADLEVILWQKLFRLQIRKAE